MRLRRLYIKNYQILRDLEIYFGVRRNRAIKQSYGLDFLVGVNGTGKSTVLRALVTLFLKLEAGAAVNDFEYELEYEMAAEPGGKTSETIKRTNLRGSEENEEEEEEDDRAKNPLRPSPTPQLQQKELPQIVVFTTGKETGWETLIAQNQTAKTVAPARYYQDSLDAARSRQTAKLAESPEAQPTLDSLIEQSPTLKTDPQRDLLEELAIAEKPGRLADTADLDDQDEPDESRLLFIPGSQIALLTLCGLLADFKHTSVASERRLREVLEALRVRSIPGFSLKFRLNSANASEIEREQVRKLAQFATRAVQTGSDYLLVFDLAGQEHEKASRIIQDFGNSSLELFKTLLAMTHPVGYSQPILQEVNIFLERETGEATKAKHRKKPDNNFPLLLFDWLSDGERSFLGRLSLFSMLDSTESLVLLDEPEVHFNDYWKRQIVYLLDKCLADRPSHVLIVSHSSITLTDVPRESVVILGQRGGYTSEVFSPGLPTFASDPGDIMIHVFGAPYAMGEHSVRELQQVLKDKKGQNQETIQSWLEITAPGYWSYRLESKLEELKSKNLTKV